MTTLLLVGATGLVGQSVLAGALADARVTNIVALTRRPLPAHPKLANPIVDFGALSEAASWWTADAVVCTLGTTIGQAGSRDAFRRVDFDFVLDVARRARGHGTPAFVFNSSLGANARAGSFYLRVKGDAEEALADLGFSSLTIVRPSLLLGDRAEFRLGERIATVGMKALARLIPRRYRGVRADRVAAALLEAALARAPGKRIVESQDLH